MKLNIVIKRFFRSKDLCLPRDFYWIQKDFVKKNMPNNLKRFLFTIIYYVVATFFCVGYLSTIPFRVINEWFENWCYY